MAREDLTRLRSQRFYRWSTSKKVFNTIKIKAKRKVEIPKGAWLDKKGQRWMKVAIDVMIGGDKFLRQITMTFPVNFDMTFGKYMVDMGDMDDFRDRVNQQYPSLERLRNLTYFPMGNKVLRE